MPPAVLAVEIDAAAKFVDREWTDTYRNLGTTSCAARNLSAKCSGSW
jgi:hypothetical protein